MTAVVVSNPLGAVLFAVAVLFPFCVAVALGILERKS